MNWKDEAKKELRIYAALRESVGILPERLAWIEAQKTSLRSSSAETFVLEDTAPEPGKVVEVTDKGFSVEDGTGNVREQAITNVPAPKRPAAEDSEPGPKLDATGAPLTEGGRKILSAQEDMDLIDPKAAGEQSRDTLTLLMMDQQPDVNIDRTVTPAPEKPSGDADVKKEEKDHDGGQHI